MSISRYIVVAVVRCSRDPPLVRAVVELAEAEAAVGGEGAHPSPWAIVKALAVVELAGAASSWWGWALRSPRIFKT
jgi:hypothetical protein